MSRKVRVLNYGNYETRDKIKQVDRRITYVHKLKLIYLGLIFVFIEYYTNFRNIFLEGLFFKNLQIYSAHNCLRKK